MPEVPMSIIIALAVVILLSAFFAGYALLFGAPHPHRHQNPGQRDNRGAAMFGNTKKPQAPVPAPLLNSKPETIVGANTSFVGTIKTDGNVRIDGSVEGDIEILGNLIIGETGRVIATIKAQNVHVSGAVKGEITAVEQLEISPSGKVWGDIVTAALHIEPGGLFRGQSAMSTNIDEPLLLEAP
ncbi:MAG TPA: polymer-forming cytoskeletal protein, partial [Roseiflexaceae bacterium]|nr:polymer-forming cytoskeletal protein [Roseiflexaceae bacterium]